MAPRRCASALDALESLRDGERVYIHGGAATPTPLLEALAERARALRGLETVSLHLERGPRRTSRRSSGAICGTTRCSSVATCARR